MFICFFFGTCAAGCPRGVPGKQAGSSPFVTPVRRGWGRENCPTVCQPWVVRARRTAPARPHCWGLLKGVPTSGARELKSSGSGFLLDSPLLGAGGRSGRGATRPSLGVGILGHLAAAGGGPALLVWLPLASSLGSSRVVRARLALAIGAGLLEGPRCNRGVGR